MNRVSDRATELVFAAGIRADYNDGDHIQNVGRAIAKRTNGAFVELIVKTGRWKADDHGNYDYVVEDVIVAYHVADEILIAKRAA